MMVAGDTDSCLCHFSPPLLPTYPIPTSQALLIKSEELGLTAYPNLASVPTEALEAPPSGSTAEEKRLKNGL